MDGRRDLSRVVLAFADFTFDDFTFGDFFGSLSATANNGISTSAGMPIRPRLGRDPTQAIILDSAGA